MFRYIHGQPRKKHGPVKWCGYCGAKHKARDCDVGDVYRESKAGNDVMRITRFELIGRLKND